MAQHDPTIEQRAIAELAGSGIYRGLSADRRASIAADVIRKVDVALDADVAQLQRRHSRPPDCREGCSHCCHYVVYATIAEIAAVVEEIDATLDADGRAALLERVAEYERVVAPSFGNGLAALRPACPLLVDGRCSVYKARPLRCRGVNSLDVGECERRRAHPEAGIELPAVPGQMELARAAAIGLTNGLKRAGIFYDNLDLGRALGIALTVPNACQRHLDGDQVFLPAVVAPQTTQRPERDVEQLVESQKLREELARHFDLLSRQDTAGARAALAIDHPAAWFRRLVVPAFYDSEDEIDNAREGFSETLAQMSDRPIDAVEAYRSLPLLQTFDLAYHQRNDRDLLSRLGDLIVDRIAAMVAPDLAAPC